jgi:hypothetical protein
MTTKSAYGKQLVYLEWVDSTGPRGGWSAEADVLGTPYLKVVSVGWILESVKSHITIAAHIHQSAGGKFNVDGVMSIPKVAITKMLVMSR